MKKVLIKLVDNYDSSLIETIHSNVRPNKGDFILIDRMNGKSLEVVKIEILYRLTDADEIMYVYVDGY